MRKWWRKLKSKYGWDFRKTHLGQEALRVDSKTFNVVRISDENGCYSYKCLYCGKSIIFPWRETQLAFYNMQRHIKAKHIDTL